MNAFVWDDCYTTGVLDVDHQHRRLVELINQLAEQAVGEVGGRPADVEAALDALAAYAVAHFADEESLVERAGVDARTRAEHRELHLAFVHDIGRMRADGTSPEQLLEFLVHWLGHHILEADQTLVRELRAVQDGLPPADARDLEQRRRTASGNDPLVRALNGLFAILSRRNAELAVANTSLERRVIERTAELAAANARLELAASTDFLTGLPNRRQAHARLQELATSQWSFGVVMLDADGFKLVNDTWGHDAGDELLRHFARAVSGAIRTDDFVARLGGDEFLVLCPGAGLGGALVVGEQVRRAVAALQVTVGAGVWHGSASVGVAVGRRGDNPTQSLRAADEALYAAKRGGRNCVATAEGVVPVELPRPGHR